MKLYYTKSACSLACRIIINEVGLPAEFVSVDLQKKRTEFDEDFLQINPKGAVPALQVDNGQILTENAVILQFLANTAKSTQLLPPTNDFEHYRVLEWLNYIATEFHKGFGLFFNPKISQDLRDNILVPIMQKKLDYINQHLANNHYLLGASFTLPDAYFFVMITWALHFQFDLNVWQHVKRYFDELKQRKSIVQSLQQEGIRLS